MGFSRDARFAGSIPKISPTPQETTNATAIDATEKGGYPPIVFDATAAQAMTGPPAIDGIGPTDDWRGYWQRTDANKRSAASWADLL